MLARAEPLQVAGDLSTRAGPEETALGRSTSRRSPHSSSPEPAAGSASTEGRAASSQTGSADVLEALGVVIDLGPEGVKRCIDEVGMGFCFAPRFHPAMRHAIPVRRELGVPTMFNFLGPLANPARAASQVIGVSDPDMAHKMLGVMMANGCKPGHGGARIRRPGRAVDHRPEQGPRAAADGTVIHGVVDPTTLGFARGESRRHPWRGRGAKCRCGARNPRGQPWAAPRYLGVELCRRARR